MVISPPGLRGAIVVEVAVLVHRREKEHALTLPQKAKERIAVEIQLKPNPVTSP
jgi:hypothetical protein